jgi:hypothetical protein
MDPLTVAAIGLGAARAVGGIVGAGKRARRDRDLIKRAYKIAQRKQERSQGYTRQSVNESLNARGVLNAGSGSGTPATGPIAAAYGGGFDQRRMAVSSTTGQAGQANTLSGGVNTDLSKEFLDEQQDLWHAREAGINATKAGQASDTMGAIGSGFEMGANVYSMGKSMKGGGSAAPAVQKSQAPISIKGAFGIDPVDPLGLSKRRLSGFDFNTGSK